MKTDNKKITVTFGRFQPPTIGHQKLIDKVVSSGNHAVYHSHSEDAERNPLPSHKKSKHLKSLFPNANIVSDKTVLSPHHMMRKLVNDGYTHVTLVVGGDRVEEMKKSIGRYVKQSHESGYDPTKHYNLKRFKVVSAGNRDPDASDVSGASGTKMREYVKNGDFESFAKYTPGNNIKAKRDLFRDVHKGMNISRNLQEEITRKELAPMLDSFVSFASEKLGLLNAPKIRYKDDTDAYNSFAAFDPNKNEMSVSVINRHPMDVFRSVAHELVHCKQKEDNRIGKDIKKEGETGSEFENEANAEAGKIMRWFAQEFPDKFKLSYIVESLLLEGVNDPGIFKAVFLAGGPGSGKDFIMKQALIGDGLVEINKDTAFEYMMKKIGLDLEMPEEERAERDVVRGKASSLTTTKQNLAISGRLGLIINGTADDVNKIEIIKRGLENNGYETMMVFVNTSDEISRQRNIARGKEGKRKVMDGTNKQGIPDGSPNVRGESWKQAQDNIGKLQSLFGAKNFHVIDNNLDINKATPEEKENFEVDLSRIRKETLKFSRKLPSKPEAAAWIQKNIKKLKDSQRSRYMDQDDVRKYQQQPSQLVSPDKKAQAPSTSQTAPTDAQDQQGPAMSPQDQQAAAQAQHARPSPREIDQARRLGLSYYGFGRWGRRIKGRNTVLYTSINGQLVKKQVKPQAMMEEKKNKNGDIVGDPKDVVYTHVDSPGRPLAELNIWKYSKKIRDQIKKMYDDLSKKTKDTRGIIQKIAQETRLNPKYVQEILNMQMNEDFAAMFEEHGAGEWGTDELTKKYEDDTPGQDGSWRESKETEMDEKIDSCWKGYEAIGLKTKDGRKVPNCVKKEEVNPNPKKKTLSQIRNEAGGSTPSYYNIGPDGIGPEYGVIKSPGGLGTGYSVPMTEEINSNNKKR